MFILQNYAGKLTSLQSWNGVFSNHGVFSKAGQFIEVCISVWAVRLRNSKRLVVAVQDIRQSFSRVT